MKKLLGLLAIPLLALPLAACGPHSNADATKAKAETSAQKADDQLVHDGYTVTHVPGFGKFDIGVSNGAYRYEAVYVVPDKDAKLAEIAAQRAESRLNDGGKAVQLSTAGDLVIARATTLTGLKDAAKAVAASAK